MVRIFSQVLSMSITASVMILLVMAARFFLRRAPKIYSYALWSVVLFRLLCPVSISSPISVLNATEAAVPEAAVSQEAPEQSPVTVIRYASAEAVASGDTDIRLQETPVHISEYINDPEEQEKTGLPVWLTGFWLAGIAVMAAYSIIAYLRLRRSLMEAVRLKGNLYMADHLESAFVLGIFRPRIYLPSGTLPMERRYIIAHERHHIRRGDHVIKLLAYAALCIHWFNPLVWAAFLLAGKDMEMSCDEAVIRKLGAHIRGDYAQTLLRLASPKRILGTPLAFGEGNTRSRVLNLAKWKKPKIWVSILCAVLCVVILTVCALNPEKGRSIEEITRTTNEDPTGFGVDDLHFTLPGGITHEMREREDFTGKELRKIQNGEENRSMHVTVFSVDGVDIGGVQDHILQEDTDLMDPASWSRQCDLWEWERDDLSCTGSASAYANWELHFESDVPEGQPVTVRRSHYLFLSEYGNRVIELWFDDLTADSSVVQEILESAYVGTGGRGYGPNGQSHKVRIGDFQLTIPKGLGYSRQHDETIQVFTRGYWSGETTVAGINIHPNTASGWNSDPEAWLETLGIDLEAERAKGNTCTLEKAPFYGDLALILEGKKTEKAYTFYIREDKVYALWFDRLEMDAAVETAILDSITFWEFGNKAPAAPLKTETASFISSDGTVEYTWNLSEEWIMEPLPVLAAEEYTLTSEAVQRAAKALFGDVVFYQGDDLLEEDYNQEEIRKKLDIWSRYTDPAEMARLYPYRDRPDDSFIADKAALVRKFVEEYTALLASAPEENPDPLCDWNFPYNNSVSAQTEVDGIPYRLTASRMGSSINTIVAYIHPGFGPSRVEDDHYEALLCRTAEPSANQVAAAKAKAETILQELGIGQWYLDDCYVKATDLNPEGEPVMDYRILVGAQPVILGHRTARWGIMTGSTWDGGASFEFAPDGRLICFKLSQPYTGTEIIHNSVAPMTSQQLLQTAEDLLKRQTRADFGNSEDILASMEAARGEKMVCRVNISQIRYGLVLTTLPGEAGFRYVPAVQIFGTPDICGKDSGTLYLSYEEISGSGTRRLLCISAEDGSIVNYPQ